MTTSLRLRDLERLLSRVPPHPRPRVELEQYATPADLAAPLLHEAYALGAALLGAARVTGVDVDPLSLEVARRVSGELGAAVEWVEADVAAWRGEADTVVMNPPFGAQVRHADRAFLDAAFRTAPVVYTLHNEGTRAFVEQRAAQAGYAVTHAWRLVFPLRHQFRHQEKRVQEIPVVALRLARSLGNSEPIERS